MIYKLEDTFACLSEGYKDITVSQHGQWFTRSMYTDVAKSRFALTLSMSTTPVSGREC